jgi:NADH dehydrogenase [ubiquinone] 1 alpha subcomplex assembly factor 7
MADALRVLQAIPGFEADVHFVDTNRTLRSLQAERVPDAHWHDSVDSLPEGPAVIFANEFFDALPIRQYQSAADGWHELLIKQQAGRFERIAGPRCEQAERLLSPALGSPKAGDVAEVGLVARQIVRQLAARLQTQGGALLIVDYGPAKSGYGDTLQAVSSHKAADPFARPGDVDLTAHVDFESLAREAKAVGGATWGPVPQGVFLTRLGLAMRATALKRRATPEQSKAIDRAQYRLSAPDQMGTLFKVMAITAPDWPAPAGFEA